MGMWNLMNNAWRHSQQDAEAIQISIKPHTRSGLLSLQVLDNGSGVAAENADKIFEPFFTTRRGKGGTGLGLNIVFNIVTQRLGGTIRAFSDKEQGTRFIVRIPQVLGEKHA